MSKEEFNSYLDTLTDGTGYDFDKVSKAFAFMAASEHHRLELEKFISSSVMFQDALRELYRKAYNDGFQNKADNESATELIDKRIKQVKKKLLPDHNGKDHNR